MNGRYRTALLSLAILTFVPLRAQETGPGAPEDNVVASILEIDITLEEVEKAAAEQLGNLDLERLRFEADQRRKRHQILEAQLDQLIGNKLLELEGNKRGLSREELLEAEVNPKLSEPAQQEIDRFYQENRSRIQASKEEVTPQIAQYLKQRQRQITTTAFIDQLKKSYGVREYLEPFEVEVDADGYPSMGPPDAPVTLVEFSDFECGFCSRFAPTLRRVKADYGDRVRVVFRHFPLASIHPRAQKAAEASLCAEEQGKFWEMHDAIFEDQKLDLPALVQKAEDLGLDTRSFRECLDSNRHAERVAADVHAGIQAGVSGTPTLFINGRPLTGAVPYEQVKRVIDEELMERN